MKVKILKASKETYWYASHIGEVFEVKTKQQTSGIWEPSREAFLYESGNTRGYIFASDCEVITEPKEPIGYKCPRCSNEISYEESDYGESILCMRCDNGEYTVMEPIYPTGNSDLNYSDADKGL